MCRRADQAAPLEHGESARTLADEVWRRLEPRLPAHAAALQVADRIVAEKPCRRLGGVAGIGVLGQQADERPLEPLVQRCQQDRQRSLADACTRRQRLGELGEAPFLRETADECVKYRAVHEKRRNRGFRALSS
jgi:hypothetical protein